VLEGQATYCRGKKSCVVTLVLDHVGLRRTTGAAAVASAMRSAQIAICPGRIRKGS
jgi:hypothetical protein